MLTMAAPTPYELVLIQKFRARLADLELSEEQKTDKQLVRWIRARENNLDHAETMYRKSFEWRRENDMANILGWKPSETVSKLLPIHLDGYDKENCPIVILPVGCLDIRTLAQPAYFHETLRYVDQLWERAAERMRGRVTKEGKPVTQFSLIFDVGGLSLRTVASITQINLIKECVSHMESNHPENFRQCYVVNASRAFQILFVFLKPLLSKRTFDKVQILTTEAYWKPILLVDIDESQLPECYGGTSHSVLHEFMGYKMRGVS